MGFKSKTTTTISAGSSAYNLAGDVASRGNYMKNTILSLVVSGKSANGLGVGIVKSHISGPATAYMRFAKWAERSGFNNRVGNYQGIAVTSYVLGEEGFDFLVPPVPNRQKRIVSYSVGTVDLQSIALVYIYKYYPNYRGQNFEVKQETYDTINAQGYPITIVTGALLINFADGTQVVYVPPFDVNTPSLYAYLYYEERTQVGSVFYDTGWMYTANKPNTTGFVGSYILVPTPVSGTKTVRTLITYSDNTPSTNNTVTTVENPIYAREEGVFTRVDSVQATPDIVATTTTTTAYIYSQYILGSTTTKTSTNSTVGGVTKTTITTTTMPVVIITWQHHVLTQTTRDEKWEPVQLVVYKQGTSPYGNSVLFNMVGTIQKFFPVIPIRRTNAPINATNFPEQYNWNKKAVRKAFGSGDKYDDILKSLENNPDVSKIDHAWIVFGVALGTQQQDGLTYLYEFFKNLADSTPSDTRFLRDSDDFQTAWLQFVANYQASNQSEALLNASLADTRPIPPTPQQYSFEVTALNGIENWQYSVSVAGKGGNRIVGSGMNPRAGGKVGNAWAVNKGSVSIDVPTYTPATADAPASTQYVTSTTMLVAFGCQISDTLWEEYEYFDLVHTNNVYGGKVVQTLAFEAIDKKDENSGFIVPLHEAVFRETNLIRRTQLSLECAFLVLNYYEVQTTTTPWYATGAFKILLIVAIIAISVATGGIGAGTAGVLGSNIAVGVSLGFAGTAAIVAGAIANALVASLVAAIITKAAGALFGSSFGNVVGAIVSMVVISMAVNGATFDINAQWAELTKADNLIKLSMSGLQEYSNHLQGVAVDLNKQTIDMIAESKLAMEKINTMTQELLKDSGVDPTMIAEATRYATERPDQFFTRTMMTGTEIADTSLKLVEEFPGPQLKLPYLD